MGEHTKEPWTWCGNDIEGGEYGHESVMEPYVNCGPWCQGGMVDLQISDEHKARIVAAVNACAGIPTDKLTKVYPAEVVERLIGAATEAREELSRCASYDYGDSVVRKNADAEATRIHELLDAALAEVGRVGKNTQETQQ